MSLLLEADTGPSGQPKVRRAAKLVGKGFGKAGQLVWRAVRRTTRIRRKLGHQQSEFSFGGPQEADRSPGVPFWSIGPSASFWDLSSDIVVSAVHGPASWLARPLQQLLWPGAADESDESGMRQEDRGAGSSRASRRRERRAARQQRRAHKRMQRQLQKSQKAAQASGSGGSSRSSTAALAAFASANTTKSSASDAEFPAADAAPQKKAAGGWGTHVLAQMINTANTFPMLLQSAQQLQDSQQQQGQHTDVQDAADLACPSDQLQDSPFRKQQHSRWVAGSSGSSSSSDAAGQHQHTIHRRPQQLLTVGCRHWGNGLMQGLLHVKIYDFAIYLDGQQAQDHLPTTSLLLQDEPSFSHDTLQQQPQQQQHEAAGHDLPAVLKAHSTPVDMSLVLKAARDVPLHLLAEEYEKVLRRRLDRVGGSQADITALQQLLVSFSDARRLPAEVAASSSGSADRALPQGPGGSVRKGAMIVFERSRAGDVTARVGPVILGTVSSPKVAEALFDLYLGDQPVSKAAKDAAAQTLSRIAAAASASASATATAALPTRAPASHPLAFGGLNGDQQQQRQQLGGGEDAAEEGRGGAVSAAAREQRQQQPLAAYYLPSSKGHEIQCERRGPGVGKRKGEKGGAGGVAGGAVEGLEVHELDACVLHMG